MNPTRPNRIDRRLLLQGGATAGVITGAALLPGLWRSGDSAPDLAVPKKSLHAQTSHDGQDDHAHSQSSTVGDVDVAAMRFDPSQFVTSFDYGTTSVAADGATVREWQIVAVDREIEIAPGLFFPSWTYNGQVPGPTLRCNEGDRLRIQLVNNGSHPHTMHFHGQSAVPSRSAKRHLASF